MSVTHYFFCQCKVAQLLNSLLLDKALVNEEQSLPTQSNIGFYINYC